MRPLSRLFQQRRGGQEERAARLMVLAAGGIAFAALVIGQMSDKGVDLMMQQDRVRKPSSLGREERIERPGRLNGLPGALRGVQRQHRGLDGREGVQGRPAETSETHHQGTVVPVILGGVWNLKGLSIAPEGGSLPDKGHRM